MSGDPWDPHDDETSPGRGDRGASSQPPGQPGPLQPGQPGPGPLQFGISGLLMLTTVVAVVFGSLRWMGMSTDAAWIVLLLLVVGGIAAVALVWAIAQSTDRRGDDR